LRPKVSEAKLKVTGMPPHSLKLAFFAAAVGCVVCASRLSWQQRRPEHPGTSTWWRGRRGPLNPRVGAGWLVFIVLNGVFAVAQPLMAAGLYVRAYVLRAMLLRKGR